MPSPVRSLLLLGLAAPLVTSAPAAAFPGLEVVYARAPAADAVHDGATGLAGVRGAWRQAPVFEDARRWPLSRQLGKVGGAELAGLGPAGMARVLRQAWSAAGGLVAVDEITAVRFGPDQAAALAQALDALGADARRVVLYVGPAVVAQVGRRDPREALPANLEAIVAAMRRAGAVFLLTYGGDGQPIERTALATYLTRWAGRWGAGDPGALHLMLGPGGADGPRGAWATARASAAGRAMLANGAGVWGLGTAGEGLAWLAGRREFLAAPTAPPEGGDAVVPVGGGLTVQPSGRTVLVSLTRPGRVVVRLVPAGQARGRVLAKLAGPVAGAVVPLPADVRPGRYRVVAVALGDGLRDVAQAEAELGPAPAVAGAPAGLSVAPAGPRRARVSAPAGTRVVLRLVPAGERRGRVVAKLTGPLSGALVALPRDVRPGRYRLVAVALQAGVRLRAAAGLRVGAGWSATA